MIVEMQVLPEWVPFIFSFFTMIGNLLLLVCAKSMAASERQNIAAEVRLYRRIQREDGFIDTVSENIKTLREIAFAIEGVLNVGDPESRERHRFRLEQLASTLTRLS